MPRALLRDRLGEIFDRPPGRYEAVDGIRALAVIWVVFFHVMFAWGDSVSVAEYERIVHAPWNWLWTKGFLAMNPFFVISGFLIGDMLLREIELRNELRFGSFYIRRYSRLAPAYYLVLVGFAVFHRIEPSHYSLDHLWASFLYVNNWFSLRHQPAVWSWSLAVEEQFYLVCPLLILCLWRTRWSPAIAIGALIAVSIAWTWFRAQTVGPFRIVYHQSHDPDAFFRFFDLSYAQTGTRLSALLIGVGCAFLKRSERWMTRFGSRLGAALLATGFVLVSLLTWNPWLNPPGGTVTPPHMTAILNPLSALSFACLLMLVLGGSGIGQAAGRVLSSRALYPIAQVSYGIYLLHAPIIDAYFRLSPPGPVIGFGMLTVRSLLVLVAASAAAIVLFVVVEAPARRYGQRIARGAPGPARPA